MKSRFETCVFYVLGKFRQNGYSDEGFFRADSFSAPKHNHSMDKCYEHYEACNCFFMQSMTCWNVEKIYIECIRFCHIACWAVLEDSQILKSIMLNIAYRIQGVPNTPYLECASTQIVFSTKKTINVWQKITNGNKNHVLLVFQ